MATNNNQGESPKKSAGHVEFIGAFEYFVRDGELWRAKIDYPVQHDGYRIGRWEAPAWMAEQWLETVRPFFAL